MPVDVAVENPDSGVVGYEAEDYEALRWDDYDVSSCGVGWERGVIVGIIWDGITLGIVVECCSIGGFTLDHLEVVAVQMERMGPGVVVIEDDLNDIEMV